MQLKRGVLKAIWARKFNRFIYPQKAKAMKKKKLKKFFKPNKTNIDIQNMVKVRYSTSRFPTVSRLESELFFSSCILYMLSICRRSFIVCTAFTSSLSAHHRIIRTRFYLLAHTIQRCPFLSSLYSHSWDV